MELRLGKRADYTVRAVLDLARHTEQGRRKAADISAEMDIPSSYLPQLLAELVRAGLVRSVAGRKGGYTLARDPAFITLLEVIEVAEGVVTSTECVLRSGPCRWDDACAIHDPWLRAQEALRRSLSATTFAEIAEIDTALGEAAEAAETGESAETRATEATEETAEAPAQ